MLQLASGALRAPDSLQKKINEENPEPRTTRHGEWIGRAGVEGKEKKMINWGNSSQKPSKCR